MEVSMTKSRLPDGYLKCFQFVRQKIFTLLVEGPENNYSDEAAG